MRKVFSFTLLGILLLLLGGAGGFSSPATAQTVQRPRFLVTRFLSKPPNFGELASATVVTITNLSGTTCEISVAWFDRFQNTPTCTISLTIDNNQPQRNFCSKQVSVRFASCDAICDPPLESDEGAAVVQSSSEPIACRNLGVTASIFYFTDDDPLKGVSNPKIVRIVGGNKGE